MDWRDFCIQLYWLHLNFMHFSFFFVSRLKGRYAIVWRKTPPKMMMGKKKRWGGRGHMTWPSPDEKHVFCGPLHVK